MITTHLEEKLISLFRESGAMSKEIPAPMVQDVGVMFRGPSQTFDFKKAFKALEELYCLGDDSRKESFKNLMTEHIHGKH